MKYFIKSFMLIAAAALAFSSCNKEVEPQQNVSSTGTHAVNFTAIIGDQSKTTMTEGEDAATFEWSKNDEDRFIVYENNRPSIADETTGVIEGDIMKLTATFEDGATAPFTYTATLNGEVSASQTLYDGKYDESSDVLVAEPITAQTTSEVFTFKFKRVVALNKMTLKGFVDDEIVSKVVVKSDKDIVGYYDLANNKWATPVDGSPSTDIIIDGGKDEGVLVDGGIAVVYFNCVPVNDSQFTIDVTTDKGEYTKTFSKKIALLEGKLNRFNVALEKKQKAEGYVKVTEEPSDWSGEYLLVYESSATEGRCWTGVDAASCFAEATIENGVISTKPDDAVTVTIASMDGGYSIKVNEGVNEGKYIYGKSGSNSIQFGSDAVANEITITDGLATILSNSTSFRYNSQSGNDRFRYYKTATTGTNYICPALYKLAGEPAPAKTLTSIAVSGTPEKTEYYVGDKFETAGLVVTGTYDDGSEASVSSGITWTIDPETLAATTTSVSVTATVGEISSNAYTVTGLNVIAAPVTINLNNTLYDIETGNNSEEQTTTTDEGITIVSGCKSSATSKTYYDSGHIRYYIDSYLKVSVDGTISKIVLTPGGNWSDSGVSVNTGTYNEKIWTGSASEVDFNFTAQCRVASIAVTYTIDTTPKFNVSCNTVDGGVLSASPSRASSGTEITLTATPKDEYTFNNDWTVKGDDNTLITVTDGTFTLPEQNVTVSGSFTKKTYAITKNAAEHGTYTVTDEDGASVASASKGDKITLTASPSEGYILDRWEVMKPSGESVSVNNNAFYMPASAVSISAYFVAEAAVPEYASLEELVAADLTSGTTVKVSFENVPIKSVYLSGSYRNGIYFDIQKGGKDIEIYYQNVPDSWVIGGMVSGTMTCPWTEYKGTWELAPAKDTWSWNSLTYTAPTMYNVVVPTGLVGGTITADPNNAPAGATVTLTATPASGYQFVSWSVKDASNNDVTVTNNAFTMPASDVTVSATFKEKQGGGTSQTVTYKQSSTSAASVSSGTAPSGSSVTFSNTYTTKDQLTKDNSMTYTLKGYAGKKITAISMSMHSNKSAGTGKFSLVAGTTTLAEIASNTGFNQSAWYGSWTQSYVTVTPAMTKTDYVIQTGEDVVLTISASANSLFCESITITYE